MKLVRDDNIRIDLKEIGIKTRNWVDSAEDRDYWRAFVNAALNLRVHKPWSALVSYLIYDMTVKRSKGKFNCSRACLQVD